MNAALAAKLASATAARAARAAVEPERFEDAQEWADEALAVVRRLALERESLTVADVLAKLPRRPDDLRAIGTVLLRAARQGLVEANGWQSGGRRRHGRPVRAWRSKVYNKGAGP